MTKFEVSSGKYYYRRPNWVTDYKVNIVYNRDTEDYEMWVQNEPNPIPLSEVPSDAIFEER